MAIVPKPKTFAAGAVAVAADVNSDFDALYNDYNGNITDANCSASMALKASKLAGSIPDSKLNTISTAGKVNVSSLTPTSNGAGGAVILDGSGKLPAIDGSQLTGINKPGFPDWANKVSKNFDTAYQASADGWVAAWSSGGNQKQTILKIGTSSGGEELGKFVFAGSSGTSNCYGSIIVPIKSGQYYKVTPHTDAPDNTDYEVLYFVPNS